MPLRNKTSASWWGEISPPIIALSLVLRLWAPWAHAQGSQFICARVTPSSSLTPRYARVGTSNLCEGFYDKSVSKPFIELVSLTLTPPKAIAAISESTVHISTPFVGSGRADLLIQPFSVATPYRVDALISSPSPISWATGQMVKATHLKLKDVGFVATAVAASDSLEVFPVRVTSDTSPANERTEVAYATVRVSGVTSRFQWRSYPSPPDPGAGSLAWKDIGNGQLYPEEWATVEIPLIAPETNTTVEFKASDSQHANFRPLRFVVPRKRSASQ